MKHIQTLVVLNLLYLDYFFDLLPFVVTSLIGFDMVLHIKVLIWCWMYAQMCLSKQGLYVCIQQPVVHITVFVKAKAGQIRDYVSRVILSSK